MTPPSLALPTMALSILMLVACGEATPVCESDCGEKSRDSSDAENGDDDDDSAPSGDEEDADSGSDERDDRDATPRPSPDEDDDKESEERSPADEVDAGTDDADSSTPKPESDGGAEAAGPEDGDPGKPVVEIDGIPCRDPRARSLGLGMGNFMFDGRSMIVDYPCEKHEGAPVTFILNLHGTTPVNLHFYQWSYFAAYKHVDSHNLVIVTPSSVVQQWGNGDDGVDEPHLMKIVEWVYETFGSKFDIRQMWVGGHSWGSLYTSRFGCKEELKDKVRGLILMSGAASPQCAARVSILNTAAGMPQPERLLDQTQNATSHGCKAKTMTAIDANNDETSWPDCDEGWVHANYLMKTKSHATSMDPSVVESLVDYINSVRP